MSSEKFENLEDDLSSTLDKLRPSVSGLSRETGGIMNLEVRLANVEQEVSQVLTFFKTNPASVLRLIYICICIYTAQGLLRH